MSPALATEYRPSYASHPGQTLRESLGSFGMTQSELARRMGRPLKTINEIIKGKAAITPDTAVQLETVLGVPANFWLDRQTQFDESAARRRRLAELRHFVSWADRFPIREMRKRLEFPRHKDRIRLVQELLSFFGVASPAEWKTSWNVLNELHAHGHNAGIDKEALSVWLRFGEIRAQSTTCGDFNRTAFKDSLREIRKLTTDAPGAFVPKMIEMCASGGVALVLVPDIPRTHVRSAIRWLTPQKAIIQQCLGHRATDQFWFDFYHDAAHILKNTRERLILETGDGEHLPREQEADQFAADFLIPPGKYGVFKKRARFTKTSVLDFARSIGIAPGIVVGRLQKEGLLGHDCLNGLKNIFSHIPSPIKRRQ